MDALFIAVGVFTVIYAVATTVAHVVKDRAWSAGSDGSAKDRSGGCGGCSGGCGGGCGCGG